MFELSYSGRIPSINCCYRTKNGKIYKTSPCRTFFKKIDEETKEQLKKYPDFEILKDNVDIDIKVYYKNKKYCDIDNVSKQLLDSFNKLIYVDDKQVSKLSMERFIDYGEDKFIVIVKTV
jgi:Holliday junction resolvase RusA-like endonuclease